jgi:hypothetical protein
MVHTKNKAGPLSERPGQLFVVFKWVTSNRGVFLERSRNHPDGERSLSVGRGPPMTGRGFRSWRSSFAFGGSRGGRGFAGGLSRSATATFGRGTAARLATAATVLAETTEQLELTTARATTARLGRAATARLSGTAGLSGARGFDRGSTFNRSCAGRLFSRTATAGFFSRTAAAATMAAEQLETGFGLAGHHGEGTNQGHHSDGGTQCKTLTHRKSSN